MFTLDLTTENNRLPSTPIDPCEFVNLNSRIPPRCDSRRLESGLLSEAEVDFCNFVSSQRTPLSGMYRSLRTSRQSGAGKDGGTTDVKIASGLQPKRIFAPSIIH